MIRIISSTILLQAKKSFARPTFQFSIILQPIIYSTLLYMMYMEQRESELGGYLLGGVTIMVLWNSMTMSSAGDIERERFEGNLENLFIAPVRFFVIMLGKVIGNTLLGMVSLVMIVAFSKIVLGIHFSLKHPWLFFASLFVLILTFCTIGLILMVSFSISRNARNYLNALSFPVYILCGLVFPIDILPGWTRPFSYVLSPTWGVKCLQQTLLGITNYRSYYNHMFNMLLLLVIYTFVSITLYNIFQTLARKRGTLGVS